MGYAEELEAHNELERADSLLGSVRGVLIKRIAAARDAGDATAAQRYQEKYDELKADEKRLIADQGYRKAILTKYPQLLESLK